MKKTRALSAGARHYCQRSLIQAEFLVELINASAGVYQLLFACIEWVAFRAYLNSDILFCASRFNNLTACALNRRLLIIGMDPFFHDVHLFHWKLKYPALFRLMRKAVE